jgi:hypothetical protein
VSECTGDNGGDVPLPMPPRWREALLPLDQLQQLQSQHEHTQPPKQQQQGQVPEQPRQQAQQPAMVQQQPQQKSHFTNVCTTDGVHVLYRRKDVSTGDEVQTAGEADRSVNRGWGNNFVRMNLKVGCCSLFSPCGRFICSSDAECPSSSYNRCGVTWIQKGKGSTSFKAGKNSRSKGSRGRGRGNWRGVFCLRMALLTCTSRICALTKCLLSEMLQPHSYGRAGMAQTSWRAGKGLRGVATSAVGRGTFLRPVPARQHQNVTCKAAAMMRQPVEEVQLGEQGLEAVQEDHPSCQRWQQLHLQQCPEQ